MSYKSIIEVLLYLINFFSRFFIEVFFEGKHLLIAPFSLSTQMFEHFVQMNENGITPVMLITDYQMPEMNGADLIRKCKEKQNNLSCVLLTGYANAIQVDDLVNDELLEGFISKPWSEEDLTGTILPILERKNLFI